MPDAPRPEEIFGQSIRGLRQELGYSQQDLADLMREKGFDWSQTIVSKTEQAGRPLRLDEAQALAEVFGFRLSNLLQRIGDLDLHRQVIRMRDRFKAARVAKAHADLEFAESRQQLDNAELALRTSRDIVDELMDEFRGARNAVLRQKGAKTDEDVIRTADALGLDVGQYDQKGEEEDDGEHQATS